MEKYNEITNHLKHGNQLEGKLRVSQIVDAKPTNHKSNNFIPSDSLNSSRSSSVSNVKPRSIISDLIPYPASSISTVIEKVNGGTEWNTIPHENVQPTNARNHHEKSKSKSANKKHFDKQSSLSDDSSHVDSLHSTIQQVSSQNTLPENKITFDSDHMGRVVKLLREKKENYTQTEAGQKCSQYVQVNISLPEDGDDPNRLDLNRSNQTLRNQLDQLSYVIEEMSRERSNTNLQMHSLQKVINVKDLKIEELIAEKEKYLADNDELRFGMKNIETLIGDYQKTLHAATAECASLTEKLRQSSQDNKSLINQSEQLKSDLAAKEELIKELYRVNSTNQAEISTLKDQFQSVNIHLSRSNDEIQNSLAHKSLLEQRLHDGDVGNQSKLNATLSTRHVLSNVGSLKSKCLSLRQDLNLMRNSFASENDKFINDFDIRRGYILEKIRSIAQQNENLHSAIRNQLAEKDAAAKGSEAEVAHLKQINEKILNDIGKQFGENETVKEQLTSKLNSLQLEIHSLKETNEAFQQKIVVLNEDCVKLRDEKAKTARELEQHSQQTNKLSAELMNAQALIDELQRWKATQNFDAERLQKESEDGQARITKLLEDNAQLQTRLEHLNVVESEQIPQYKAQLESIQAQLNASVQELQSERQSRQKSLDETNAVRAELKLRKEKITNLESNLQTITKKYLELSQRTNNRSIQEQVCQTVESGADIERMKVELQRVIDERDAFIRNQSQQLATLTAQCEQMNNINTEMQTKIEWLENCLKEGDSAIQERTDSQQLDNFKTDIAKEKERSKGLSQSLFNEKRLNNKLKKEVNRLKQQDKKNGASVVPTIVAPTEQTDLSELDLDQLNALLRGRIAQMKDLASEIESRKVFSSEADSAKGDSTGSNCEQTEHSAERRSSSSLRESLLYNLSLEDDHGHGVTIPNDVIIQILQEPVQSFDSSNNSSKPLSKLHSSIEDIKQELNSLKQSLIFEPALLTHSPSID